MNKANVFRLKYQLIFFKVTCLLITATQLAFDLHNDHIPWHWASKVRGCAQLAYKEKIIKV